MRVSMSYKLAAGLLALSAIAGTVAAADLGRQTLAANDGWGAFGIGVTGGSLATSDHVYVVTTRAEFIAALNNGVAADTSSSNPSNLPKILYVKGNIDFNVDATNQPLKCEDYFRPDPTTGAMFSYEAFDAAFDPATFGRGTITGPQERARLASMAAQQARVRIR